MWYRNKPVTVKTFCAPCQKVFNNSNESFKQTEI